MTMSNSIRSARRLTMRPSSTAEQSIQIASASNIRWMNMEHFAGAISTRRRTVISNTPHASSTSATAVSRRVRPYACAAEDLAEGEIVDFNNCYVITDANGQDAKEIAATKIWDELGDVCIDDNECIDSEFYGYPIGTFREDIWHDIEDQLEVPIHELMFPDDANKDMTNERSLAMSNENKNTNVKEETTWTNFKFFNNQVKLKTVEKDDRQMYLADCRFMPGSVANGIDLGDQNGISGHMTVFLTEKQYFKAAEQKANGEQINVGLPSTQLKDGKIEVNFYNHESKEAHTIQVNPFAASKANQGRREAFFERKDAEREPRARVSAQRPASARGGVRKAGRSKPGRAR